MKLINYIPNFEDYIDIHLTKKTWVWIQNDSVNGFCVELHHENKNGGETLVDDTFDFMPIHDFVSKKDIISKAISEAIWLLPVLYFRARNKGNIELAKVYYETLTDIWFDTKQYKYADLGKYMYDQEKGLPF